MSIIAFKHDLTGERGVEKGRGFSRTFSFTDSNGAAVDLTGYAVAAQARTKQDKNSQKIIDFVATHNDALGQVTIAYDDTAYGIKAASGFYDIALTAPGGDPDSWVIGAVDFPGRSTEVV